MKKRGVVYWFILCVLLGIFILNAQDFTLERIVEDPDDKGNVLFVVYNVLGSENTPGEITLYLKNAQGNTEYPYLDITKIDVSGGDDVGFKELTEIGALQNIVVGESDSASGKEGRPYSFRMRMPASDSGDVSVSLDITYTHRDQDGNSYEIVQTIVLIFTSYPVYQDLTDTGGGGSGGGGFLCEWFGIGCEKYVSIEDPESPSDAKDCLEEEYDFSGGAGLAAGDTFSVLAKGGKAFADCLVKKSSELKTEISLQLFDKDIPIAKTFINFHYTENADEESSLTNLQKLPDKPDHGILITSSKEGVEKLLRKEITVILLATQREVSDKSCLEEEYDFSEKGGLSSDKNFIIFAKGGQAFSDCLLKTANELREELEQEMFGEEVDFVRMTINFEYDERDETLTLPRSDPLSKMHTIYLSVVPEKVKERLRREMAIALFVSQFPDGKIPPSADSSKLGVYGFPPGAWQGISGVYDSPEQRKQFTQILSWYARTGNWPPVWFFNMFLDAARNTNKGAQFMAIDSSLIEYLFSVDFGVNQRDPVRQYISFLVEGDREARKGIQKPGAAWAASLRKYYGIGSFIDLQDNWKEFVEARVRAEKVEVRKDISPLPDFFVTDPELGKKVDVRERGLYDDLGVTTGLASDASISVFLGRAPKDLAHGIADELLQLTNHYRDGIAEEWLGETLPPGVGNVVINVNFDFNRDENAITWALDGEGRKSHNLYITSPKPENVFGPVLHHEMTHVVLATAYPFEKRLPSWVEEGIASRYDDDARKALRAERLAAFKRNPPRIGGVLTGGISPGNIEGYTLSSSLVEFLVGDFSRAENRQRFIRFASDIKDNGIDAALQKHYGIQSVLDLERQWHSWLG